MSLNPNEPAQPRTGDYIVTRGRDTQEEREDAAQLLSRNGCQHVRFERLEDGRLQAHGYLRAS